MTLTKARDIRQHTVEELEMRVQNLRREHYELVQKKEVGQLDRPHRMRQIRREVSQIMTIISEKRAS